MNEKLIKDNYDDFLRYYYNCPCRGCPEGHPSFWKTIIESEEWKKWKEYNFKTSSHGNYDFSEDEELGILGKEHWKEFCKFINQLKKDL